MFKPASLMIGARVANMALGIISIPVLLSSLGVDTFAAWAVLLGGGAAFATLELGLPVTIIRYLSVAAEQKDQHRINSLLTNAAAILLTAYGLGFLMLSPFATRLALWLHLPETNLCSPSQLLLLTFSMVAVRAILNLGVSTLYAMRHFRRTALFSFLQAGLSNTGAWLAALYTGRLDLVLITYWGTQILVLFVASRIARQAVRRQIHPKILDWAVMKEILLYGLRVQLNEWSLFFNFQFNKFIIASQVGISAVAPYELANRGGMALRSIPSSGLDTVLPGASIHGAHGRDLWSTYLASLRVGIHTAIIFLLIPMILSPLFLYAWAGPVGSNAALAFLLIMPGVMVNILTLPAGLLLQAMRLERLLVKTSLATIGLNIVWSVIGAYLWGINGAAAASAAAMLVGGIWLTALFHRYQQRCLLNTVAEFGRRLWPVFLICPLWGASALLFQQLLVTSRLTAAALTMILYIGCAVSLVPALFRTGWLYQREMAWYYRFFHRPRPGNDALPLPNHS